MYRMTAKAAHRRKIERQVGLIGKTIIYGVPILLLNHLLNLFGDWLFGAGWGIMM